MDELKQWLEMDMEWPFTSFRGKLKDMDQEYRRLMPEYLAALERSAPEHRQSFSLEIFESLYFAVEADDAVAIRRIYSACPELSRSGHLDGCTPLGKAIEEGRFQALTALLECGFDPDANSLGFGEDTITQLLWSDHFREDVLFGLLEAGAYLEPRAVMEMVLEEKVHLLPRAMELAQKFDPAACWEWIREDDRYAKEQLGNEGLTSRQLHLLREILVG